MSSGKITEILGKDNRNITQRLGFGSKKTEIMRNTDNSNVTWVMGSEDEKDPVQIGTGTRIADYLVKDVLSENTGEATLLLAEWEGTEFVIKLYHKNKTPKDNLLEILNSVDSDYVIKSIEQGVFSGRFFEVLPYYRDGDLLSQIPMDERIIEEVIVPSVNEGLKALHDKDIIHRDIKPSNIFLTEDKSRAIIGDFGISSILNHEVSVRATSMSRTLGYSAPEASNGFVSKESDYYSFGITILHLALGMDPFAGMSDMQILFQTITKKIEIPQNISYRLQILIKGLTLKDRNDRWGYEEVSRWINGENITLAERSSDTSFQKPYNFLNEEYHDLVSLSFAFAQNWENTKKHLFRGLVDKYLSTYNEEMASLCIDCKEMEDKDLAVFNLIYILNPNAPLCYKGRLFNDLESLGDAMAESAPNIDPDIYELIKNGALYQYLSKNKFDEKLLSKVSNSMENMRKRTSSNDYFKLMYILNPSRGYMINGIRCEDISDLIEYLESVDNTIRDNCADKLIANEMFLAWVEALGYKEQITKWREIYTKVEW